MAIEQQPLPFPPEASSEARAALQDALAKKPGNLRGAIMDLRSDEGLRQAIRGPLPEAHPEEPEQQSPPTSHQ